MDIHVQSIYKQHLYINTWLTVRTGAWCQTSEFTERLTIPCIAKSPRRTKKRIYIIIIHSYKWKFSNKFDVLLNLKDCNTNPGQTVPWGLLAPTGQDKLVPVQRSRTNIILRVYIRVYYCKMCLYRCDLIKIYILDCLQQL